MKRIKITKKVEITFTPDEVIYGDMPMEQIAAEEIEIIKEYGESFLISAEGDVDESTIITWEIVEEDAKKED